MSGAPLFLCSQSERAERALLRQDEREYNLMTEEQNQISSTGGQSPGNRLYTAEVSQDLALNTTTISLSSTDQSNSSRNTLVSIAPEFGSNLFRFRAGEHNLIYTDQELLTRS